MWIVSRLKHTSETRAVHCWKSLRWRVANRGRESMAGLDFTTTKVQFRQRLPSPRALHYRISSHAMDACQPTPAPAPPRRSPYNPLTWPLYLRVVLGVLFGLVLGAVFGTREILLGWTTTDLGVLAALYIQLLTTLRHAADFLCDCGGVRADAHFLRGMACGCLRFAASTSPWHLRLD